MCLAKNGIPIPPLNHRSLSLAYSSGSGGVLNWKAVVLPARPTALVCYLCGREFGTASLDIHLKSCTKKWDTQEAYKPARDRKPLPQPPSEITALADGAPSDSQMKLYNDAATEQFNNLVLEPCTRCGRTFNPEA